MTCKEKLIADHPEWTKDDIEYNINTGCPSDYGYLPYPNKCIVESSTCLKCWNREIPEIDEDENEEENIVTPTSRKTKAELLEEIEQLHKELEEIKNAELYQQGANQLKAMHAAYMIAGFTDEQSFELLLTMIRAGIKH